MRIAFGTSATVWKIGGDPTCNGTYTYVEQADIKDGAPTAFPSKNERMSTASEGGYFAVQQSEFESIPGSPIVYWLSEKMRQAFTVGAPLRSIAQLRQGMATGDNNRFLRLWWEVSQSRSEVSCTSCETAIASGFRWFPYNKGGSFRKWYGNHEYMLAFNLDDYEVLKNSGNKLPSRAFYFSPSVSWSKVSSGAPAFRAYPQGFVFDVAGTSIFAADSRERSALLSFLNSQVALEQLIALAPTLNYEVGQVSSLPVASVGARKLTETASSAVFESKLDWDDFESSWDFVQNPLLKLAGSE